MFFEISVKCFLSFYEIWTSFNQLISLQVTSLKPYSISPFANSSDDINNKSCAEKGYFTRVCNWLGDIKLLQEYENRP